MMHSLSEIKRKVMTDDEVNTRIKEIIGIRRYLDNERDRLALVLRDLFDEQRMLERKENKNV